MKYWFPKFDGFSVGLARLGGPGLGNLLFPWARALIGAALTEGQVIFPVWPQLKLGPIIRREADWRFYGGIFRRGASDLPSFSQHRLKTSIPFTREDAAHEFKDCVVVVQGLASQFEDLKNHRALVRREFVSRLTPRYRDDWSLPRRASVVAVHIRLGDFTRPSPIATLNVTSNTSTPIEWYADVISRLSRFRPGLVFELYSDGTLAELAPVLALPNVRRPVVAGAMGAIISMSQCHALIASGSTFSRWASYLGELPTLYFPGQMRSLIFDERIYERERLAVDFSDLDMREFLA